MLVHVSIADNGHSGGKFNLWIKTAVNQRDGIYRVRIACRNLLSRVSVAHFITH